MPIHLAEEWIAFETMVGSRPKFGGKNIAEIRQNAANALVGLAPLPPSTVLEIHDQVRDGFKVRVYTPVDVGTKLPLVLFMHGGGYCLGDLDSEEATVRLIAESLPAVVVSVGYRLAPESKWPQSLNDCVAAAQWALVHFDSSSFVDQSKVIVAGGSAGAQLALATTIKLLESDIPVHGVVVLAPLAVGQSAVPERMRTRYRSMVENADAPLVDTVVLKQLMEANGHDETDPYFSILVNKALSKLPKTDIVTCGADCLRDDGFLLADELKSHGIPTVHDNYSGYPHYFWAMPNLKINDVFRENLVKGLKFAAS